MADRGAIIYRGPSLLTGDPIVAAVTGLEGTSHNPKTGPMVQSWILRADRLPMDAVRDGSDTAICGTCALRGDGAAGRRCYVTPWFGPTNVWKAIPDYMEPSWADLPALVEGRAIRLGAYGDPAAVPFEVWQALLHGAAGWVGYTHAWRTCDRRFQALVMASVDTEDEGLAARLAGWRTFRVRRPDDAVVAGLEFVCPASDEAGHRTTCQRCQAVPRHQFAGAFRRHRGAREARQPARLRHPDHRTLRPSAPLPAPSGPRHGGLRMRGTVDINLEDVVILLEDGPHSMGQLAGWLSVSVPTVKSALVRLGRAGRVRCVGPQRLWEVVPVSADTPPADSEVSTQKSEVSRQPVDASSLDVAPEGDEDAYDADAALADEFLEPVRRAPGRPKQLRQAAKAATARGDAWWVGLSRADLQQQAAARAAQNSATPIGRAISPVRGISRAISPVRGISR